MKEQKDIDQLFKDRLKNPEVPYNEPDWEALDEKLHPKTKRRIIPFFWITATAGLAAMLLIVFVLISNPNKDYTSDVAKQTSNKKNEATRLNPAQSTLANPINQPKTASTEIINVSQNKRRNPAQNTMLNVHNLVITDPLLNIDLNKLFTDLPETRIVPLDSTNTIAFADQKINTEVALPKLPKASIKITKTSPRLILGITAAPDLTSVQNSGKSSLSGGIGIEATLFLTKRLSITTGAAYTKKIYDSDFNLYNPKTSYVFKNQPSNIHANCDVIDIPLNINYRILGNQRNSLTLSTGLSSYLMLKEDYYYSYEIPNSKWPQSYEVKNQNQHVFGIANIGATFQHKVSDRLSIGITPFVKVPLTNIGYGNSKLSSTGVAVSVNMMNLFQKKESPSIR